MTSPRARREWRIFLWISVVSAILSTCFGYFNRNPDDVPLK